MKNTNRILKLILLIIVAAVSFQLAASGILTFILSFFPDTARKYGEGVDALLELTPAIIFLVCVLSPVLEEFVFRGPLFTFIRKHMPFMLANVIQSILFAVYHGNLVQGVYAFIAGLFIGYLVKMTGSILYSIVFHSVTNIFGMLIGNTDIGVVMQVLITIASSALFISVYYLILKLCQGNETAEYEKQEDK